MYITIDTSAIIAVIGNAFSAMFKRNQITIDQAKLALNVYHQIPIKFIDMPLEKSLEVADFLNIYVYDAYIIQCAQQTSTSILTLDKRLQIEAKKIGVNIIEVSL